MNFTTATLRRHIALASAYINLKSSPSENKTLLFDNRTLPSNIFVWDPTAGGNVVNVGGGEGGLRGEFGLTGWAPITNYLEILR